MAEGDKKEAVKPKIVLPDPKKIASTKPIVEEIAKLKEGLTKAKAAATKDGKFSKYAPKYRNNLKRLKRAQRSLRKEVLRCKSAYDTREAKEKVAADAAAAAAKKAAEAAPPAEEKKEA